MADKDYVIIGGYGRLAVPMEMLEKICHECYMIEERFDRNTNRLEISNIEPVTDFKVLRANEFSASIAQYMLSKK
jgi:hypothetical protein